MNLQKQILTKNNCYKAGRTIKVKGLMLHSTGANNPNLKRYVGPDDGKLGSNANGNHWNQATPDGRSVCVHGFIGKLTDGTIATYQTLPWNYRGWHCGSGSKGSANDTHIGVEICEDGLSDGTYFSKVYTEAVELFAYLCKEHNLNPTADGVIICHSEGYKSGIASNHSDVMHWFPKHGKSMDTFRADVATAMGKPVTGGGTSGSGSSESGVPATVRNGSTGEAVKRMQTLLIQYGYTCGSTGADGRCGKNTVLAIESFQSNNGLDADGICGTKTWTKLLSGNAVKASAAKSANGYTVGKTYIVTAKSGVNIRSGASSGASKKGALPKGSKVMVTDIVASGNYTWLKYTGGYVCAKEGNSTYIS